MTMSIRSLTYYRDELIPMLEDRQEIDAASAIRVLADRVDRLRSSRVARLRSNEVWRMGLGSLKYYRYELIPMLEDRQEIDAAIAIRDLADEIGKLQGNMVRDEARYRSSLQAARNERIRKGYKKPNDLP